MKHLVTKGFGAAMFVVAVILAAIEALHLDEMIEKFIPESVASRITPTHTLILAGAGILLYFAESIVSKVNDPTHEPVPSKESSSSVISTPTASPVIDASQKVEIHNYPSAVSKSALSNRLPAERIHHNVEFVGASKIKTDLIIEIRDNQPGLTAIKACFLNRSKAGVRIADFDYARARIVFRDKSGIEIAETSNALWLGQGTDNSVHITANTKRSIVLAIFGDGDRVWFLPYWTKRPNGYWEEGPHYQMETDGTRLPDGELTAEITLVGEENIGLQPVVVTMTLGPDGEAVIAS